MLLEWKSEKEKGEMCCLRRGGSDLHHVIEVAEFAIRAAVASRISSIPNGAAIQAARSPPPGRAEPPCRRAAAGGGPRRAVIRLRQWSGARAFRPR